MKIQVVGHTNPILLFQEMTSCGNIEDGVCLEHEGEGGWVIAFRDLQKMYRAACKARKEPT